MPEKKPPPFPAEPVPELPHTGPMPRAPEADERGLDALQDDIRQPEPEPAPPPAEPDWASPVRDLATGQQRTQEAIERLSEIVERVARPAYVQPPTPQAPPPAPDDWRAKLQPEHADLLSKAISQETERFYLKRRQEELDPAFIEILRTQDRLMERALAAEFPDPDFGFDALKDEVMRHRQQQGNRISLEQAFNDVFNREAQKALRATRADQQRSTHQAKVDEGDAGKPPSRPSGDSDLTPEERAIARAFYPELKPEEADQYYLRHKRGMGRERHSVLQKRDLL